MTITQLSPTRARLRAARGAEANPHVEVRDGQFHGMPELMSVIDRIRQRLEAYPAQHSAPETKGHTVRTDPRTGLPCHIYTSDGSLPPPPIEHDARHRMWRELSLQESKTRIQLSHLGHTEPPAWELLTHSEIEGLLRTYQNLEKRLMEYRLRADVDNGPRNGRRS